MMGDKRPTLSPRHAIFRAIEIYDDRKPDSKHELSRQQPVRSAINDTTPQSWKPKATENTSLTSQCLNSA